MGVCNVAEGYVPKVDYGLIVSMLEDPGFDPLTLAKGLNPTGAEALTSTLGRYVSQQKQ